MERETNPMRFSNQVAVVTGGGTGIGRAIALALAREGARVALWDLDPARAEEAASEIRQLGREVAVAAVDVSHGAEVDVAARGVLEQWGRVDILVNNAGICRTGPIESIGEAEWDLLLAVNLKGVFLCSRALMGSMKRQRSGAIINMASVAGKVGGFAVGAHYSASKAGVICFTKSLARELAPHGVRVNCIAPGVIETDMSRAITGGDYGSYHSIIPLGRIGQVDEIARVAVFLASEDASYIAGEIIDVNGGQFMD